MSADWFAIGTVILILVIYIIIYNSLVSARQKVKQAWAGIDVQLKRRYDLIPNLVDTVKAYADFEKDVLDRVVKARSQAIAVPDGEVVAQGTAEGEIVGTLSRLFALAEAYPDIKANKNYLALQKELANTEDQIAAARRIYNANVNELNTKVKIFPQNLVASIHNFTEATFFEISQDERNDNPKVRV